MLSLRCYRYMVKPENSEIGHLCYRLFPGNVIQLYWKIPFRKIFAPILAQTIKSVHSHIFILRRKRVNSNYNDFSYLNVFTEVIYNMITKNNRYLLWNRGLWRSLNNTCPILLTPCIRRTNHLCDSCDLTDNKPHFIPSLLRMIQNVDILWRHRCKRRSPAIVTSQWPIVSAWLLRTLS